MNTLSRTIKYLTRKKSKSILLLLVFLVVNVMLLSTNAMIHSLENTKDEIKQNTKSKFIVNIVDEKYPITNTVIDELQKLENINFINKRSNALMSIDNIKAVNDTTNKNQINVIAYDDLSKDSLFEEGKYKLTKGAINDVNENGIIINHIFAELNSLKLGDTLKIDEGVLAKIVGIFESNDEEKQPDIIASKDRIENQIFINQELMNKINENQTYTEVYVYVSNPDLIQKMQNEVSQICKDYDVTNTNTLYQQIKIPLDQVQRVATLIQIITIITSCVITTLLLSMWIRARYKEMAVMISLGTSKFQIYFQTFLESFILLVISSILASVFTFGFIDTLKSFMPTVENISVQLNISFKLDYNATYDRNDYNRDCIVYCTDTHIKNKSKRNIIKNGGIKMSDFKRAIRSIFRKPVKSILLLCVVTFIGVFMVVGFASKNTNVNLQDNTRQAVGASYQLELNMNNRRERLIALGEKLGEKEGSIDGYWQKKTETGQWISGVDNSFETVLYDDIMKISKVEGISQFNITSLDTAVNPVNFKRIEDKDADQSYYFQRSSFNWKLQFSYG